MIKYVNIKNNVIAKIIKNIILTITKNLSEEKKKIRRDYCEN